MSTTYKIEGTRTRKIDGSQTTILTETLVPDPVDPPPVDPKWITRFDFRAGNIARDAWDDLGFNERFDFTNERGGGSLEFREHDEREKLLVQRAGGKLEAIRSPGDGRLTQFLPIVDKWKSPVYDNTPWYPPYGSTVRYTLTFQPVGFPLLGMGRRWALPIEFYPTWGQTEHGGQNPLFAPYVMESDSGQTVWKLLLKSGDRTLPAGTRGPGPGEIRRQVNLPFSTEQQTWEITYLSHATDGRIVVIVDGMKVWEFSGCTVLTTTTDSSTKACTAPIGCYTGSAAGWGFVYGEIKIEEMKQ